MGDPSRARTGEAGGIFASLGAAEAVALAQRTKRELFVYIRSGSGGHPSSGDQDLVLHALESDEEAGKVLRGIVAIQLEEGSQDASNLRSAYPAITETPAAVLISPESGGIVLLLQGTACCEGREVVARIVKAQKEQDAKKIMSILALTAVSQKDEGKPESGKPTRRTEPTGSASSASASAEDIKKEKKSVPTKKKAAQPSDSKEVCTGRQAKRQAPSSKGPGKSPEKTHESSGASASGEGKVSYDCCQLCIRLTNGESIMKQFSADDCLQDVFDFVKQSRTDGWQPFILKVPFSSVSLDEAEHSGQTLRDLDIGSRAMMNLIPVEQSSSVHSGRSSEQSKSVLAVLRSFLLYVLDAIILIPSLIWKLLGGNQPSASASTSVGAQQQQPNDARRAAQSRKGRRREREEDDPEYWNGNSTQFLPSHDKDQ